MKRFWVIFLICFYDLVTAQQLPSINTKPQPNDCFKLSAKSSKHKLGDFELKKCCPLGWQLDQTSEINFNGVPCAEANNTFSIDLIYMTDDKDSSGKVLYDLVEVINVVVQNGTKPKGEPMSIEGKLFLDQDMNLVEIGEDCTMKKYQHYCVDLNASEPLVGIHFEIVFNAETNILVPCMISSIVCLVGLIFVYFNMSVATNLHGLSLLAMACSLIVTYLAYTVHFIKKTDDEMTDNGLINQIESISVLNCTLWHLIMWSDLCLNLWWYLPNHEHHTKQLTRWLFRGFLVTFFILSGILFFSSTSVTGLKYTIGCLIVLCVCLFVATWIGYKNLYDIQVKALQANMYMLEQHPNEPNRVPRYEGSDLKKMQIQCRSASFLLAYGIISLFFVVISYVMTTEVNDIYLMFGCLAGVFIVCNFFWSSRQLNSIKNKEIMQERSNTSEYPLIMKRNA